MLVLIVMVCTEFGKSRKVVELERAFCRYGGSMREWAEPLWRCRESIGCAFLQV